MTASMTGAALLRRIPRFHPVLVGLLVLATVGADLALTPRTARAAAAWTTTDLNLRSGPSTGNSVILVMPAGSYVEIVENLQNNFYRVRYNGTSGWAYADFLSRTSGGGGDGGGGGGGGGATGNATVATNALNLRAGPSTGDAVLAVMPNGAGVTLTGDRSNGFVSVTYNGMSGWAYESYLSSGGSGDGGGGNNGGNNGGGPTGSAAVAVNSLNLRSDASTSSSILAVMPNGAGVTLTGNRANGFVSVTYNGMSGWAYESYLNIGATGSDPDPAPDPGGGSDPGTTTGTASTTTSLNLRSGPSTSNSVLMVMPAGASVELTGNSENGFNQVRYNGTVGWAYAQYLSTGGGTTDPGDGGGSGLRGDTNGDGSLSRDEIIQIIYAAADRYGQPREDMLRVANCESNLIPSAVNGPGQSYGLFQFKTGTWASTPYANDDIFDAWASANAAGWMWSVGRRNEWVCQ